jgi:hypothetical protein
MFLRAIFPRLKFMLQFIHCKQGPCPLLIDNDLSCPLLRLSTQIVERYHGTYYIEIIKKLALEDDN